MTSGVLSWSRFRRPVVAVDDAAIEIVQIGGRETAAFQRNERTQIGRNHRQHFEDHPFGTGLRGDEALDELEALGDLLADLLALGVAQRLGRVPCCGLARSMP